MKKFFSNFDLKLTWVIFPTICGLVLITVFTRITTLFTEHLTWIEEAARYLMIWMAFLSIGVVAKDNSHFRMTAFTDSLPSKLKKIVNLVADSISIIFMSVLVYFGSNMILKQMNSGQLSPILKIPIWIPYLAIPIGILNMMIRTIIRTIKELTGKCEPKEVQ